MMDHDRPSLTDHEKPQWTSPGHYGPCQAMSTQDDVTPVHNPTDGIGRLNPTLGGPVTYSTIICPQPGSSLGLRLTVDLSHVKGQQR